MKTISARSAIKFPLYALAITWSLFMLGILVEINQPETYWPPSGEPVYPEPRVQLQVYLFLLAITVFAMVAQYALKQAVQLRLTIETPLARAAHRFNNLGVILSLLAGAIFAVGNFLGAWNRYDRNDEPVWIRLLNVYVPIILATALVVYVILSAFVFRKDAPDIPEDQRDEERAKLQRAVGLAYAAPIIGTAIAIIFGLVVYDITKTTLDTWIWVVIQAIIAVSIILGTTFAAKARAARPLPPREHRSGVAAVNLNFVLSIVFGVVVLVMAFSLGAEAINNLVQWPEWRENMADEEYRRTILAPSLGWFVQDLLPAMVLLALAEVGIYRTLVIRNSDTAEAK